MIPLCVDQGVGLIPWSPLARGKLTRDADVSTARSETDEFGRRLYVHPGDRDIVDAVRQVAEGRGIPRAQIALAWVSHNPAVSAPIVGARTPEHLQDAVAAVNIELTDDEVALLEQPYQPHPVAGF